MEPDDMQWREYRTEAEAQALKPRAQEIVDEVIRRLPPGTIEVAAGTLFVGRYVPEEVGCFAATLIGIPRQLAPVEFELNRPFDESVESILTRLLRWRQRVEAGETV
jgi:hypothetical protein